MPSRGSTGFMDWLFKYPLDDTHKELSGLQSYFMQERTARAVPRPVRAIAARPRPFPAGNQGPLLLDARDAARKLNEQKAAHNIAIFGQFRISNPSQKLFQAVTDMIGETTAVPNDPPEFLKQQQHLFAIPFTLFGLRCRNGPTQNSSLIELTSCSSFFFDVYWRKRLAPDLQHLFLSWEEHQERGDYMILCADISKKKGCNHSVWAVPDRIVQLAGGRLHVVSFMQQQSFAHMLKPNYKSSTHPDVQDAKKIPRDLMLALPDFHGVEADVAMSFSHAGGDSSSAQPKVLPRAFAILAGIEYKARPAALPQLAALCDNDVANLIGAHNGDRICDYRREPSRRGYQATWHYSWIWLAAPEVDT